MSKRLYKFKIKRVEVATLNVEIESGLPEVDTVSSVLSQIDKQKSELAFKSEASHIYMESMSSEPVKESK